MIKNIHIIPTDKLTKISISKKTNTIVYNKDKHDTLAMFINQNIYITSDEEIKEGDWVYNIAQKTVFKADKTFLRLIGQTLLTNQKIILTTDQDLIKDGVQAIDNKFLEWFVKNPNCEEIEVINHKKLSSKSIYNAVEGDLVYSHKGYGGIINSLSNDVRVGIDNYVETAITSETGWETLDINNYKIYDKCYKIIIPKEESKISPIVEELTGVIPKQKVSVRLQNSLKQFNLTLEEAINTEPNILKRIGFGNRSIIELQNLNPKQETLEENSFTLLEKELIKKAKKVWQKSHPNPIEMTLFGAKWQQERSYSEEEVLKLLNKREQYLIESVGEFYQSTLEWFEQFKKK